MALKSTIKEKPKRTSITMRTKDSPFDMNRGFRWWDEKDATERSKKLISTVGYLKNSQQSRQRQAAVFARLYGGQSIANFVGTSITRLDPIGPLAPNRPTYNIIGSVIDTLVSKLTQSRPSPVFLTDNGDYKARFLSQKLTKFTLGELYRTKAYEKGAVCLLHTLDQGTGALKVFRTPDDKVGVENVLCTELYVDLEEAAFGDPRRLYQLKLYDREVLAGMFPKYKELVGRAEKASIDATSAASGKSVSDLVMVVEGWSLPSTPDAEDGVHTISCSAGELFNETWTKSRFPFVFLHHHKRLIGFWSQGVAEALIGTQFELNSLLDTISKAIKLVGVPRVFVEEGSKVNKASFSNRIGVIVPYKGTPPIVNTSPCVPQEMYAERDRLIQYGYQQEGLSFMEATAQKPAGLNSGEAIRSYDDIATDRFAAISRRYDTMYIDLAYLIIDEAVAIAKDTGKYSTVYPDRKGTQALDLPEAAKKLKDPFVIQCFNESSLPRDPAGRKQTIAEHVQSGMLTIQQGRRLLNFPDMEQVDTLASAAEERIYCYLDRMVEEGEYSPPDPFMNLQLAEETVVSYYNLYEPRKLEEERCELLRTFHEQIQMLKQQAVPPGVMPAAPSPTAAPEPTPTNPMVPNSAAAA